MGKYQKKISFFIGLLMMVLMMGCGTDSIGSGDRSFWLIDTTKNYQFDPSAWYKVYVTKKAENDRVIVYVDVTQSHVTAAVAEQLAHEFRNSIYNKVTTYFASPYDFDGNGKTILVVCDIRDNFSVSGTYVGGYFWAGDFESESSIKTYNRINGTSYQTNEGDILYIDTNPQDITNQDAWETIAHEFQHLVNASYKITHGQNPQDTWIDEGLAEAANHVVYGEVTSRITYFNASSAAQNGHPLFYWDNSNVLVNSAQLYLFFQYMRSQSASNNNVFKSIIQSSSTDYQAVEAAMALDVTLSGWTFDQLLLRWHATNRGVTGTNYGYDSEITTAPLTDLYSSGSVTLRSGGGIVKSMGGVFSSPASNYIYLSVNTDGSSEDFTGSSLRDRFVAVHGTYHTDATSALSSLPAMNSIPIASPAIISGLATKQYIAASPQKIDLVVPRSITKNRIESARKEILEHNTAE